MKRNLLYTALVAFLVSCVTLLGWETLTKDKNTVRIEHINNTPSKSALFALDDENNFIPLDFTKTAEEVLDAVVHIKSTYLVEQSARQNYSYRNLPDPFRDFFGEEFERFFNYPDRGNRNPNGNRPPTRVGSGSGVILSEDGYIITNNHVIADADDIEVTLYDNRTYKAAIVGTDPSTDLALIRIKEDDLPTLAFVDSDDVRIGEWVLAVGNPFSLTSTVTAGIVSAKGRNINILREQYAIENFIQTDAAINPGNSGGALVNLEGGLVGINTAIASPTGVYSGYGFAVPGNIVRKVVEDLIEYGIVQRGVLGVLIRTVDGNLARSENLDVIQGVYVDSLMQNSAAEAAGIKPGDVITHVNKDEVKTSPELQGIIARYRPGEKVSLTINRDGKVLDFDVVLNNREGTTDYTEVERSEVLTTLGIEVSTIDKETARANDIHGGVIVNRIYAGKIRRHTQMNEGFIITKVDGRKVSDREEFIKIMEGKKGGVMLEGVYRDLPGEFYYAFGM